MGGKSLVVVYLPMLEWLPRLRLNGSALPLSGPSPVSVSLGFFFLTFYINTSVCAYLRDVCDLEANREGEHFMYEKRRRQKNCEKFFKIHIA